MDPKTIVEVLFWIEDLFDRHGIERSYGGAFARNFYAPPRFTKDLDLLVLVSQLKIPELVQDLGAAGARRIRIDERTGEPARLLMDLRGFLDDLRAPFRLARLDCFGVTVEVFFPWHPFDHEVLRGALARDVGGRIVRIHRPEHLIVYKKIFDRSKDIEDIKAILVSNAKKLDLDEIRRWARQLLDATGLEELDRMIGDFCR